MFRFKTQIAGNSLLFGRTTPRRRGFFDTKRKRSLVCIRSLTPHACYACSRFATQKRYIFALKNQFMIYSVLPILATGEKTPPLFFNCNIAISRSKRVFES